MTYGDKRDYRKIDIYVQIGFSDGYKYVATTTWSATCKEAKAKFLERNPQYRASAVHCQFA